jgi:hypothetical protein
MGFCPMIIGRFKARLGLRISRRRLAPASALARNTHHDHNNRTGETWPPNGVRRSASA